MIGIVKVFKDNGFGFIQYTMGSNTKEIYFHVSNYSNESGSIPNIGERVQFEIGPAKTAGKPNQAVNVTPIAVEKQSAVQL